MALSTLPDETGVAIDPSIVHVIEPRESQSLDRLGFHFLVTTSGVIYRLEGARDQHQPRFWCFRISRCTASGFADTHELPWFGGERMTRDALPEAVEAIRSSFGGWLALPQHDSVRQWILDPARAEPPLNLPLRSSIRRQRVA